MLARFFGRSRDQEIAARLYGTLVARAREPVFYRDLGVADSLDGRFDLIALHAFLVLHRLKASPGTERLAQALFDFMFGDMDRSLREMGVGDLGVSHRVKHMVSAFYGRVQAYEAGLAPGSDTLGDALARNLYRGQEPTPLQIEAMVDYTTASAGELAARDIQSLSAGEVGFAELPSISAA